MRQMLVVSIAILIGTISMVHTAAADDVDQWLQEAQSDREEIRLKAIHALGQSGDLRALPVLLEALHDQSTTIRHQAIAALRALAKTIQDVYHVVAEWIEDMLDSLSMVLTPEPKPEIDWIQGKKQYI